MKTIKQIANELGVSKTAVRKHLTDEIKTRFAQTISGVIYISSEGETLISQSFSNNMLQTKCAHVPRNQFADISAKVNSVTTTLQEQLKIKDDQITALQQSLISVTAALEEAQETAKSAQLLHAGTIHQQLLDDNIQRSKIDIPQNLNSSIKENSFTRWFKKKFS